MNRTVTTYDQVTITRHNDEVFGEIVMIQDKRIPSQTVRFEEHGAFVLSYDNLFKFTKNAIRATLKDLGNDARLVQLTNDWWEATQMPVQMVRPEENWEPTEADCWDGDGAEYPQ